MNSETLCHLKHKQFDYFLCRISRGDWRVNLAQHSGDLYPTSRGWQVHFNMLLRLGGSMGLGDLAQKTNVIRCQCVWIEGGV